MSFSAVVLTRTANRPLGKVLTYKNIIYLFNLQIRQGITMVVEMHNLDDR